MGDLLEYPDVLQEIRGALNPGRLKLQGNTVIFKNVKTGKIDQYQSDDVEKVSWLKRARGYCLKFLLGTGVIHRYDGFKETDYEKLSPFITKNYDRSLDKVDMSVKGWNWGSAAFEGNSLSFKVDRNLAFEVPLGNVSHATTAKNEVTLEFHQNDDAAVSLMELRFFIPPDGSGDTDPVEEFYKKCIDKADIIQATGEAIVMFSEVYCLTPRGRYDVKIYPTFLQLHGKTFDYKIPYTTVLRLFLLPHKDGRQIFFVVSLDPPMKQGQTRYHFLIILFQKEDEMTIELSLSENELNEKYDGKLQPEMSGAEYDVISRIFKAVLNRKITVPGSFVSNKQHQCINCSYKAATGLLYPLERGFIFVHKPPVHIRFDEVASVNFARSAGSSRSFDFDIATKTGATYTFNSIEKDEYGKLYDFITMKKLRVKNIGNKKSAQNYDEGMDDSGDEGAHDAYMERMKAEGQTRQVGDEDDDSDTSDESFNPDKQSASDVAEEYDSNPPTTDSDDSDYSVDSGSAAGVSGEESVETKSEEERRKERKQREKERRKDRPKSAKTVSEGGKPRNRKSKNKDPNMPKRPQSVYMIWLNDVREKIKEDNPNFTIIDISKKGGELWRELKDKSKWEKLAEKAKEDYVVAMAKYKEENPDAEKVSMKESGSKKKSPSKSSPKKESKAGSGQAFKSKEFISSSEASGAEDDKPAKKKHKGEGKRKSKSEDKAKTKTESEEEESAKESDASDGKPSRSPPSSPMSGAKSGGGEESDGPKSSSESGNESA